MNELSKDDLQVLKAVGKFESGANWYKIGRIVLHDLEDPAHFSSTFEKLVSLNLVSSENMDGQPLPVIRITQAGRLLLAQ